MKAKKNEELKQLNLFEDETKRKASQQFRTHIRSIIKTMDNIHVFSTDLSVDDRHIIHELAEKFNLLHTTLMRMSLRDAL